MLSEPLHGRHVHGRFDAHEEPRTAGDALSSLKRSLAVNLNERERCRNKELQARQELQKAEGALQQAHTELHEQRKEAAALRSQLEDQGIQQRRLQEKCKSHNTVGACLEATVTKLRTEVRDGDKLYQEMTAWIEQESRARRELVASAKSLTERFTQMEAALSTAEANVVDLQKEHEVSQCKLAELQRGQVADKAKHAAEIEKLEAKAREALTAKDDLYRDLLSLQKAQGEMREALAQEKTTSESLKNQLVTENAECMKTKHDLEQLKNVHSKLTCVHDEMSCSLNELEGTCSKLREEKSELEGLRAQLKTEAVEMKEQHIQELASMSDELKQVKETSKALQATVQEAQDSYAELAKQKQAASVAHESEAAANKTHATALQLEVSQLQELIQDLKRKHEDIASGHSQVAKEKAAVDSQLQVVLQQTTVLKAELETAQASIGDLEISELTCKLDEGAKELEKAQKSFETTLQDCEQHVLKRSELECQISALSAQIQQERTSNELALEEKLKCVNADKAKVLNEVEKQAAEHVRKIQERTVQLQAEVSEKDSQICKLQTEMDELHKLMDKSRQDITAVKEEHLSHINRLEAVHAAALSAKAADTSQLKTLLDDTEAEKVEKVAELNRVQQALSVAQKKLGEEEHAHKEKINALELELDQEQNQNEELEAQVAELTESIDLEKCERKSIEAELEKSNILLRKYQGSQVGADMTPVATPRTKSHHGNVVNTLDRNTLAIPGSVAKKRKRQGGGHDSVRQLEGKRSKRKNGAPQCSKSQGSKPPTAPHKKTASSSQMQRRGRLARMSNSAAASDRVNGAQLDRNQAGTLTSTEIFGGLLLGNL